MSKKRKTERNKQKEREKEIDELMDQDTNRPTDGQGF